MPTRSKMVPSTEREIIRLYMEEKLSGKKIAKILPFTVPQIQYTLKKNKIKMRKYADYYITPLEIKQLIVDKYINQKLPLELICKDVHMSRRKVVEIIKETGFELRRNKTYGKEIEIINSYKNNTPIKEIAFQFKISKPLVFIILKKNNIRTNTLVKPRLIITEEFRKEICDLYLTSYLSINEVAKKMKISSYLTGRILKKEKIEIKRNRKPLKNYKTEKLTDINIQDKITIINLYTLEKKRVREISQILKISEFKIYNLLKEENVTKRKSAEYHILSSETENEIAKMYQNEGEGINSVSRKLKISVKKVKTVLKKRQIELKDAAILRSALLTSEAEKQIIEEYIIQQISYTKICRKFKIGQKRFKKILTKHGYETRKSNDLNHFKMTREQEEELLKAIKSEYEIEKIQTLLSFKCGKKHIRDYLMKNFKSIKTYGFYEAWKDRYGEKSAMKMEEHRFNKLSKASSGKNNPMYGKPSPQGSGNGWKGWYKDFYFRSLRELSYVLYLDANKIPWTTGEAHKFDIKYKNYKGTDRTYRPDFFVNNEKLVEIKPKRLQKSPNIVAKTAAAIPTCKAWGLRYEIIDFKINPLSIKEALDNGLIEFARDYKERFLDYLSRKDSSNEDSLNLGE